MAFKTRKRRERVWRNRYRRLAQHVKDMGGDAGALTKDDPKALKREISSLLHRNEELTATLDRVTKYLDTWGGRFSTFLHGAVPAMAKGMGKR